MDKVVALLEAWTFGDTQTAHAIEAELPEEELALTYPLALAFFTIAVKKRFPYDPSRDDVYDLIDEVQSKFPITELEIDKDNAKDMIYAVVDDEGPADVAIPGQLAVMVPFIRHIVATSESMRANFGTYMTAALRQAVEYLSADSNESRSASS